MDGTEYTVIIYGDANCDGNINILDAVKILNVVKGKMQYKDLLYWLTKYNSDIL